MNTKNNNNNKHILLKIENITSYITFPPQIACKLIEAGRSAEDTLQVQGLSTDGQITVKTLLYIRKQSYESTRADWLKIVFV